MHLTKLMLSFIPFLKLYAQWHSIMEEVTRRPLNVELYQSKLLDLLAIMAEELGFNIKQTVISRAYIPELFSSINGRNDAIAEETLRALRNTEHFGGQRSNVPNENAT